MAEQLDYEINKELGECYLFMGDMDKAEEYYTKAAGSNGIHPDPYLGLATIAVQRGELEKALSLYEKAASIEETDKSIAGIGLIRMENGEQEEAFTRFIRSLELNPENIVAVFGLVQAGTALGRLNEVLPHLDNCLALDPLKHDVRFTLAGCLVSLERIDEAREHLERILEHDPDYTAAKELYGQITS